MRIYNPDIDNFSVWYDKTGPNAKLYTINSMEIKEFDDQIANHIKKHLANKILHRRGIRDNAEDDLKRIYKEIEVKL